MFLYDENGSPIGMQYRTASYAEYVFDTYFFEKNLQGDVVAVINSNGIKIGYYYYDAWGNIKITLNSSATALEKNIVRSYNPFRYRGYYYDTESGFYYLQSRYYNPYWGRFINVDGLSNLGVNSDLQAYNLFIYCSNNPIMNIDPTGNWNWKNFWIGTTITVTAVAVVVGVALAVPTGGTSAAVATAVIIAATATTGAIMTYAAAEETTAVSDLSLSFTNGAESATFGVSLVVDFENEGVELYPHFGMSEGISSGVTYSTGLVNNYSGPGSYGGKFFQGGGGYLIGLNHCFDPDTNYANAVSATTFTFSSGFGYGGGIDWYFDPITLKHPRK